MPNGISNWTQFKWPYAPLSTFTRSEPFPSDEMKATYLGDRPKKKNRAKLLHEALLARKQKGVR